MRTQLERRRNIWLAFVLVPTVVAASFGLRYRSEHHDYVLLIDSETGQTLREGGCGGVADAAQKAFATVGKTTLETFDYWTQSWRYPGSKFGPRCGNYGHNVQNLR